MAASYVDAVVRRHAELIERGVEDLKNNLANRGAIPDYNAYVLILGKIEGLREALQLCEEAIREINAS